MVQELLNRSEAHLWAVLSNGLTLRLLRDSTSLVGSAYIEFDLEAIFDADLFALLARDTTRTPDLDEALQILDLQSPKRAGRPWTERRRGALKLLRKQAWLLGAQALLTLGVILASPWLPFAG